MKDCAGLRLVDFFVVPHDKNWEMGKAAQTIRDTFSETLDLRVISDNQAIVVSGDEVRILER